MLTRLGVSAMCTRNSQSKALEWNSTTWDYRSENVIKNKTRVYNSFNNRCYPAYRKPDVWLRSNLYWIQNFGEERFLGRPKLDEERSSPVAYPDGSALILSINFVNGALCIDSVKRGD